MTDVLERVRDAIEARELLTPGDRVVVGVSGGPDSLCLLHVLRRLRKPCDLRLHVAHLNHGARAGASDADAKFVRGIARAWDLPITVDRRPVPALAGEYGLAFEEAARRVRYAFLRAVAEGIGANRIAVGHNADDQAETVLMHLIRGSGLAGLRGMLSLTRMGDYRLLSDGEEVQDSFAYLRRVESQKQGDSVNSTGQVCIVRPLLGIARADIDEYCADHSLQPRFDRSNLDMTHFRNRLRHELIPELETYNPKIRQRLCHLANVATADYDLLAAARDEAFSRIMTEEREGAIVFDQRAWAQLPVSLQRATLRRATYDLRRSLRDVSFVHVENARKVALKGRTGQAATLPMGLELSVAYGRLIIGEAGEASPPPDAPLLWKDEPLPVSFPGTTPLPQSDWVLTADAMDRWKMTDIASSEHPWTAHLDLQAFGGDLVLRRRRAGDRFQPLGMGGDHVKISELMINLKIPEAWRDHAPLLMAGEEILWLCGHRIAERARVDDRTEGVARFHFEQAA